MNAMNIQEIIRRVREGEVASGALDTGPGSGFIDLVFSDLLTRGRRGQECVPEALEISSQELHALAVRSLQGAVCMLDSLDARLQRGDLSKEDFVLLLTICARFLILRVEPGECGIDSQRLEELFQRVSARVCVS